MLLNKEALSKINNTSNFDKFIDSHCSICFVKLTNIPVIMSLTFYN